MRVGADGVDVADDDVSRAPVLLDSDRGGPPNRRRDGRQFGGRQRLERRARETPRGYRNGWRSGLRRGGLDASASARIRHEREKKGAGHAERNDRGEQRKRVAR